MIRFDYDQDDWGAIREMEDGSYGTMNPDKIIIHWGGSGTAEETVAGSMDRLRRWDRYHTYSKGWLGGLAYNFAVDQLGKVYRCRGINQAGATSGDFEDDGIPENKEGLAVVWIGGSASVPTEAAYEAMERVIIDSGLEVVIGHMEVRKTQCPGPDWMQFVAAESWTWPQPSPRFEQAWDWGIDERILTRHSQPKRLLDYEHFIALLQRYDGTLD